MGQTVSLRSGRKPQLDNFADLRALPPEIAVSILANLDATDLCLAGCVWDDLASNEVLWKRLCLSQWQYIPNHQSCPRQRIRHQPRYKDLYLMLDEAMLLLRSNPTEGILFLQENNLLGDHPAEIAKFINCTKDDLLPCYQKLLEKRLDILNELVDLQDFSNQKLSQALRCFFRKVNPAELKEQLDHLLGLFAARYHQCNSQMGLTKEATGVLSYSLILLSVDLYSPHVKNKMSKREFIRNNRRVLPDVLPDLLGDLYDDVYVNGHVALTCLAIGLRKAHQYERPYGVLFELKSWSIQLICS